MIFSLDTRLSQGKCIARSENIHTYDIISEFSMLNKSKVGALDILPTAANNLLFSSEQRSKS
jgi:hypothetical protein